MKVKKIIRVFPGVGKTRWLVQMRNGANAVMTASELVADLRGVACPATVQIPPTNSR